MSGAGAMPVGSGPFGGDYHEWQPTVFGTTPSSRLPTATDEQEQLNDGTGSFKGTSDAFQRAAHLIAREFYNDSEIIGPSFVTNRDARVRKALSILIDGPAPVLILESVTVESEGSHTYTRIDVRDPLSGQVKTLQNG